MTGEVHGNKEIIVNPENYEEMIKKLQEREDEQLQKVLARRKAETADELKGIAGQAIVKRQLRTSSDQKPLKDRQILTEAKSEEVAKLKERLDKETTDLAKQVMSQLAGQLPSLSGKLKGRVKPGGGESAAGS